MAKPKQPLKGSDGDHLTGEDEAILDRIELAIAEEERKLAEIYKQATKHG